MAKTYWFDMQYPGAPPWKGVPWEEYQEKLRAYAEEAGIDKRVILQDLKNHRNGLMAEQRTRFRKDREISQAYRNLLRR